jgi:hypothetical protein
MLSTDKLSTHRGENGRQEIKAIHLLKEENLKQDRIIQLKKNRRQTDENGEDGKQPKQSAPRKITKGEERST